MKTVVDLELLAGQKFGCIYADPPWKYGNQATRASTDKHYLTMTVDEICSLPIADLAAKTCHMHLWTTNGFLPDSFRVLESWGFTYKSMFVWCKPKMGMGNYWRLSHEVLLLGIKGSKATFRDKSLYSWGRYKATRHSAKPPEVRGFIERASPGPYLELFGRRAVNGWTVWGNEIRGQEFRQEAFA